MCFDFLSHMETIIISHGWCPHKYSSDKACRFFLYLSFILLCINLIFNCLPKYCSCTFIHSDLFGCPIMLCIWHVCRCWLKKLIKYFHNTKMEIEMSKCLGNIMHFSLSIEDVTNRLQEFYFSKKIDFINYFKD